MKTGFIRKGGIPLIKPKSNRITLRTGYTSRNTFELGHDGLGYKRKISDREYVGGKIFSTGLFHEKYNKRRTIDFDQMKKIIKYAKDRKKPS